MFSTSPVQIVTEFSQLSTQLILFEVRSQIKQTFAKIVPTKAAFSTSDIEWSKANSTAMFLSLRSAAGVLVYISLRLWIKALIADESLKSLGRLVWYLCADVFGYLSCLKIDTMGTGFTRELLQTREVELFRNNVHRNVRKDFLRMGCSGSRGVCWAGYCNLRWYWVVSRVKVG